MRTRTDTIPRRIQRPGMFAGGDGSTLSLDFTAMSSLDSRFTFTRSTTATFINSQGYVQFADHNLVFNSTMLVSNSWTANTSGGGTVTINNDNTVTFSSTSGRATWLQSITIQSGLPVTFSIEVTALTNTNIRVSDLFQAGTGFTSQVYNYTDLSGNTTANIGAFTTLPGIGLYTVNATTTATSGNVIFGTDCNGVTRTGNVTIARPQLQYGTRVSNRVYLANSSTSAANTNTPRFDYDPTTLTPRGLLIEGAATNYALSSEAFSTSNWGNNGLNGSAPTATSQTNPENTASSIQFVEDTSTGVHGAFQSVAGLTAGTVYTLSAWVKSDGTRNFGSLRLTVSGGSPSFSAVWSLTDGTPGNTLTTGSPTSTSSSIVAYPNGWYRIQISMACPVGFTAMIGYVNGSNTNTLTTQPQSYTGTATKGIYVWGAQFEVGGGATSYIPTVASQGQRTVDTCVMSGTNFSSWFNATQGTLLTTWSGTGVTSGRYATINDGSVSNQIWTGFSESAIYNGSFQASFGSAATANGKVAIAYLLNDAAFCLNGGAVSTDTSVTLPTGLNQIFIGNSHAGNAAINTSLRTVKYFPLRLTNAQIQAITT